MGLTFQNNTPVGVRIVVMLRQRDACQDISDSPGWLMGGWFHVDPGGSVQAIKNDLTSFNRHFYFWAQGTDGRTWHGNGTWTAYVPREAFTQCYGLAVSVSDAPIEAVFERVDFIEIVASSGNVTYHLM